MPPLRERSSADRLLKRVEEEFAAEYPLMELTPIDEAALRAFREQWRTHRRAPRCQNWDWVRWVEDAARKRRLPVAVWLRPWKEGKPELQALIWISLSLSGTSARLARLETYPFIPHHPLKKAILPLALMLLEAFAAILEVRTCRIMRPHSRLVPWYDRAGYRQTEEEVERTRAYDIIFADIPEDADLTVG